MSVRHGISLATAVRKRTLEAQDASSPSKRQKKGAASFRARGNAWVDENKKNCVPGKACKASKRDLNEADTIDVEHHFPCMKEEYGGDSLFNLQQAPVFYPTKEEFDDAMAFIRKIRPLAEKYGICRIVPPKETKWDYKVFHKRVKPNSFSFHTKAQKIHQLLHRRGPNFMFLARYRQVMSALGKPVGKLPMVDGRELDLYKLYHEVERCGGYDKVCEEDLWQDIAPVMKIAPGYNNGNPGSNLRRYYKNYLADFHEYMQKNKKSLPPLKRSVKTPSRSKSKMKRSGNPRRKLAMSYKERVKASWKQVRQRAFFVSSESFDNVICSVCYQGDKADKLVLCSNGCLTGKHLACMDPPLKQIPRGKWYCEKCKRRASGTATEIEDYDDYGYGTGKQFSLSQFKNMADEFEYRWFQGDEDEQCPLDIEREYWRIVEKAEELVTVYYGSDLDVGEYQSGFPLDRNSSCANVRSRARMLPTSHSSVHRYMATSGWTPNNMPLESFLKHVHDSVAGVTRPMLYVGMLFSSFCWHVEDNFLYSVNYVHTGAPKTWYGVPSRAADHFEQVVKELLPGLFEVQPNLLHLLITMVPPTLLQKKGVPVTTTIQNPGEFILTFPRAYHAGFNNGFNVAESVNFALDDWIDVSQAATESYRFTRSSVFPHEQLMFSAAKKPETLEIALKVKRELRKIVKREEALRKSAKSKASIKEVTKMSKSQMRKMTKNCKQCEICGYDCFLSGVSVACSKNEMFCLNHADAPCSCKSKCERTLIIRDTSEDMQNALAALDEKIAAFKEEVEEKHN